MAGLKFTVKECDVESQVGARESISVSIALASADWRAIGDALGEISNREGSELRTDFPEGWTLFWKVRDGDSRFFVAHPESDQWVATLAVSATHLARIREGLARDFVGPLGGLERVARMSNLEVRVVRREGAVG